MSKMLREYGYAADNGTRLTDWHGKTIGRGRKVGCTKVRPDAAGGWISGERCSYQFKIKGLWYGCRGRGDGVAVSCRVMKSAKGMPSSKFFDKLDGARRHKRRRR